MPLRAGSFKRITNPDDEDQFIDVPIVDDLTLLHGKGQKFQRNFNKTPKSMGERHTGSAFTALTKTTIAGSISSALTSLR